MRRLAAACVTLFLAASPAFAVDILGRYTVQGKGPDGSTYSGTVDVKKTGTQTYEVVWNIDGTKSVGTGIGADGFMAVSYRTGNTTGICAYSAKSDSDVQGVWTYAGGKTIGGEVWSR